MKLWQHTLAAGPLAFLTQAALESWPLTVIAAGTSILVDLDHLPDYLYYRRRWLGLRDFFKVNNQSRLLKTLLILHAWEWVLIILLASLAAEPPLWLAGLGLGLAWHLLLDSLTNGITGSFYWITFRAWHHFDFVLMKNLPVAKTTSMSQVKNGPDRP